MSLNNGGRRDHREALDGAVDKVSIITLNVFRGRIRPLFIVNKYLTFMVSDIKIKTLVYRQGLLCLSY